MTPLYVLVRLWIRDGQEARFEAYERKVFRLAVRYGGAIERVIRRAGSTSTESEPPFEVHVVRFPSEERYEAYRRDPDRDALAAERAEVIARSDVLVGFDGPRYDN